MKEAAGFVFMLALVFCMGGAVGDGYSLVNRSGGTTILYHCTNEDKTVCHLIARTNSYEECNGARILPNDLSWNGGKDPVEFCVKEGAFK